MVPSIRNILGGFLFSGDDVDKPVRVLSGGERTRLAVARMLLRPSNTLLLDEPTNHLDLDSKDVLLEALEDFGGTLIFVSHDRYFVDKLATKVIEIGGGEALDLPGQLRGVPLEPPAAESRRRQCCRSSAPAKAAAKPTDVGEGCRAEPARSQRAAAAARSSARPDDRALRRSRTRPRRSSPTRNGAGTKLRLAGSRRRRTRCADADRRPRGRIADREQAIKEIEATMSAPGFYDNRERAQADHRPSTRR